MRKELDQIKTALTLLEPARLAFGLVFDALPDEGGLAEDARVIVRLMYRLEMDLEETMAAGAKRGFK